MQKISKKLFITLFVAVLSFFTIGGLTSHVKAEGNSRKIEVQVFSDDWSVGSGTEGVQKTMKKIVGETSTDITEVDGDGIYKATLDFTAIEGGLKDIGFFAIQINEGEDIFGDKVIVVDNVKFDGVDAVEPQLGKTYTVAEANENDGVVGVSHTRLNLYNKYVQSIPRGRSVFGSSDVTATPIKIDGLKGIKTISIDFRIQDGVKFDKENVENNRVVSYINYASFDWATQYWYDGTTPNDPANITAVFPEVTGYGQYTTSISFANPGKGFVFFDIEILNGELNFPMSYMQIDEFKLNGQEIYLNNTYTSSDNKVDTRTNLYNSWQGDETISDARTFTGLNFGRLTARPIVQKTEMTGDNQKTDYILGEKASEIEVSSIEVTFTLMNGATVRPISSAKKNVPEEGIKATIEALDSGLNEVSGATLTDVIVKGYGQYTTRVEFPAAVSSLGGLSLILENGEEYFPTNFLRIDSLKINGEEVEITAPTFTYDDLKNSVTSIYHPVNKKSDETSRTAGNILYRDASSQVIDVTEYTDVLSVEITFTLTVGGFEEYEMPKEFNAFLMFLDTEDKWKVDRQGANEAGETKVTGDGKYTVYVKASDIGVTGKSAELAVLLVDIIGLRSAMEYLNTISADAQGKYMVTDMVVTVKLYVDGQEIAVDQSKVIVGDIEENKNIRIELFNKWGQTASKSAVDITKINPEQEVKVEFTLSGTGIEGETPVDPTPVDPTPVDPTPNPTTPDKEPAKTNNTLVIIMSVIAVLGIGTSAYLAVLLNKKNK